MCQMDSKTLQGCVRIRENVNVTAVERSSSAVECWAFI